MQNNSKLQIDNKSVMKNSSSMKIHANIEDGKAIDPRLERYATRLRQLDKDGNGEIDLQEVCDAIDQMVDQEKQTRLMKKLSIMFGILTLLSIAAIVGLTYAVVSLSKDVQDNNNVLVSKDSGLPMSTSQYQAAASFAELLANPSASSLSKVHTLVTPGTGDANYTVNTVTAATVMNDGSVVFYLGNGESVKYKSDSNGGFTMAMSTTSSTTTASGRKLQQNYNNQADPNKQAVSNANYNSPVSCPDDVPYCEGNCGCKFLGIFFFFTDLQAMSKAASQCLLIACALMFFLCRPHHH